MGFEVYTNARDSALRNGERAMAAAEEQRTRTALQSAGAMYASGDRSGASSALATSGDISGAMAIDRQTQTTDDAARERQQTTFIAGATGLRRLPSDQRWAAFNSRVVPALIDAGLGQDVIAGITEADMADGTLDSIITGLGGEVASPYANDRSGPNGSVLRPGADGAYAPVYTAPVDPNQGVPAGYRRSAGGDLEYIPGGPADPRTVGTRAAAGRAPPRARSGGGGRSSGGGGGAPARSFSSGSIQWD